MAIQLTSTKDAAALSGMKFLVHGPAGAGKTRLCATTGEPTVIISAESGVLSLREFDIPVIEVKSLDQLYEAYAYVTETEEGKAFVTRYREIREGCLINALKADDALNHDIGELARLLRVLSGMYDQAARSAASL